MTASLTWIDAAGNLLTLTDPANGINVPLGALGLDAPPVLNTTTGYVSLDGSTLVKRRRDARSIVLPLLLRDQARVQTVVAQVVAALQGPGALLVEDGTNSRTLFNVVYDGGMEGDYSPEAGVRDWKRFVVALLALDPWWYDAEQSEAIDTTQATDFDEATVDFDDEVAFDGSAETVFLVEGDTTALPIWTIVGPFTALLVGLEGGQAFSLAAPLADGDTIVVDTRPGNRGPRLNGGPIDWSLLTPVSRLWELPVGSPTIIAGASGVDGGSAVTVAFKQRWLTP